MTPKPGFDGWIEKINELERRVSALENRPAKQSNTAALAPGFNAYGVLIGTLTGSVPVASVYGDPTPVEWDEDIDTDGSVSVEDGVIQCDSVGQFRLAWELSGSWPAGFHRFDPIDGVSVCVIEGGNMYADPKVVRGFVNRTGPKSQGMISADGDCIALGITSQTTHQDPVSGQAYAVPTAVRITLTIHRLIEG